MSCTSKKTYEKVAEATCRIEPFNARQKFAEFIADYFEEDNEKFDRDRFLIACNVMATGKITYITVYVVQYYIQDGGWVDIKTTLDKGEADNELVAQQDENVAYVHRIVERREVEC